MIILHPVTVTIIGRAVGCTGYDATITAGPSPDRIFSACGRGCITVRGRISATTTATARFSFKKSFHNYIACRHGKRISTDRHVAGNNLPFLKAIATVWSYGQRDFLAHRCRNRSSRCKTIPIVFYGYGINGQVIVEFQGHNICRTADLF